MSATVITITSGKGGVGKTTATANLSAALAMQGKRVVAIDADIGLRNLDVVMGLENRIVYDLVHVVEGTCRLVDGATWVDLQVRPDGRLLDEADLAGLTVYVPDSSRARLFVNDREAPGIVRNPPDETGMCSISLPWAHLEFPRAWR